MNTQLHFRSFQKVAFNPKKIIMMNNNEVEDEEFDFDFDYDPNEMYYALLNDK